MENDKNNNIAVGEVTPRRKIFSWFWKVLAAAACIELGWLTGSILTSRKKRGGVGNGKTGLMDAGMVDQFQPGEVKAVPQGQFYLVCLEDGSFMALSRTCTHLGCTVPWDGERGKFVCPCHGSTYDKRGVVLTPPAVRPLDYYRIKIENGLIRIDTSRPLRREAFEDSQATRA